MSAQNPRRIALLTYPFVDLLDVAGPSEVFGATQRALAALGRPSEAGYSVEVLSNSPELAIETDSAVALPGPPELRWGSVADRHATGRGRLGRRESGDGSGSAPVVEPGFPRWLGRFGMAFAPFPLKIQRF
jgi:hypothetical protein